jgi:hypothetical protein
VDDKWRTIGCSCSNGIRWSYYEDGPDECRDCIGGGQIYIRPKGHLFQYPGGPAMGIASSAEYRRGTPVMPFEWHCWADPESYIEELPIDDTGSFMQDSIVHCSCGIAMTIAQHDMHCSGMKLKFRESHEEKHL